MQGYIEGLVVPPRPISSRLLCLGQALTVCFESGQQAQDKLLVPAASVKRGLESAAGISNEQGRPGETASKVGTLEVAVFAVVPVHCIDQLLPFPGQHLPDCAAHQVPRCKCRQAQALPLPCTTAVPHLPVAAPAAAQLAHAQ